MRFAFSTKKWYVVFFGSSAEDHVFGGNIILVTTRDVLSFAQCISIPFQLSPHVCVFWSTQCELCGCCCSAQRGLCESCQAHQVPVFRSLADATAFLLHETMCS